jgi:hypothetical protein
MSFFVGLQVVFRNLDDLAQTVDNPFMSSLSNSALKKEVVDDFRSRTDELHKGLRLL